MALEEEFANEAGLSPLSDLSDFDVAEGYPDVRGWPVYASDGDEIGKVKDLIVDVGALVARYLVIKVKTGLFTHEEAIAPIGQAHLAESGKGVYLDFGRAQIMNLRPYDRSLFGAREDFTRPDYDANRFWGRDATRDRFIVRNEEEVVVGKRQVPVGEAVVRKDVETETFRENVPLVREEVTVERRPAGPYTVGNEPIVTEDEVRIPLMAEEAVVEKRVVPKEEVVIKKTLVEENREVTGDLKRERVTVEGTGVRTDIPKKEPV